MNKDHRYVKLLTQLLKEYKTENRFLEFKSNYQDVNALGKYIFSPDIISSSTAFAHTDYMRRIICNIIGKWVENGEYTSDEKTLKKLIEDILYNNLKEAIS